MSYTMPNGHPQGVTSGYLDSIREALIAELIAINEYAKHIADSDMDEINNVWREIMQEEKDHYGMFLSLLRKYDAIENKMYLKYEDTAIPVTPIQAYRPEYDRQLILNNLREDIKGELEAVILYDQNIRVMPYSDMKKVFMDIIDDEKEHVEHLTRVLIQYDPDKYNGLK
jgi:rubrerythrin